MGRQSPLSLQTVPSTTAPPATVVTTKNTDSLAPNETQIGNAVVIQTDEKDKICRDFVWGICSKNEQCKFRHELNVESMRDILKFCHDYQNRTGCTRPDCTYLHTSREEENLFLTTGQIPRVLAERYAAMTAALMNSNVSKFLVQVQQHHLPHPLPAPPPALQAALLPPPPPPPTPPPTPRPTNTSACVWAVPATFSAPRTFVTSTMSSATQPAPPRMPMFDVTRPPPPLPTYPSNSGAMKRAAEPLAGSSQAGPSKVKKSESSKVVETDDICVECQQIDISFQKYQQELESLMQKDEDLNKIYEEKRREKECLQFLLKSQLSPEFSRILENFMEDKSLQLPPDELDQDPAFDSTPGPSGVMDNEATFARLIAQLNPETKPSERPSEQTPSFGPTPGPSDVMDNATLARLLIAQLKPETKPYERPSEQTPWFGFTPGPSGVMDNATLAHVIAQLNPETKPFERSEQTPSFGSMPGPGAVLGNAEHQRWLSGPRMTMIPPNVRPSEQTPSFVPTPGPSGHMGYWTFPPPINRF